MKHIRNFIISMVLSIFVMSSCDAPLAITTPQPVVYERVVAPQPPSYIYRPPVVNRYIYYTPSRHHSHRPGYGYRYNHSGRVGRR